MDSDKVLYISLAPIRGLPSFIEALGMLVEHLLWHYSQPLTTRDIRRYIREGKVTPHPLKIDSVSLNKAIQQLVKQGKADRIIKSNKELYVINNEHKLILDKTYKQINIVKKNAYLEWEKRMLKLLNIIPYSNSTLLNNIWEQTLTIMSEQMFNLEHENNNNYELPILLSLRIIKTLIEEKHSDMVKYINYLLSSLIYTYKLSKPKDIKVLKIVHVYIDTNILINILGLVPKEKEDIAEDIRELVKMLIKIGIDIYITKYTIEEYNAVINKTIKHFTDGGTSSYSIKDIVKHYKTSGSRLPPRDYYVQYRNPIEACKRLYNIDINEYAPEYATQIEKLSIIKEYENVLRSFGEKENIEHDAKVLAYIDAINGREDEYKITALFLTTDSKLVKAVNSPRVVRPDTLFLFYGQLFPLTDNHETFVQKMLLDSAFPIAMAKANNIAAIVSEEIETSYSANIIIENILSLEGIDISYTEEGEILEKKIQKAEDIKNKLIHQFRKLRQEILQEAKRIEDKKALQEVKLARSERDKAIMERKKIELEKKTRDIEQQCLRQSIIKTLQKIIVPSLIFIYIIYYILQATFKLTNTSSLTLTTAISVPILTYILNNYFKYCKEKCLETEEYYSIKREVQELEQKARSILTQ